MDKIISIGLNVGSSEPSVQLDVSLRAVQRLAKDVKGYISNIAVFTSEWEGVKERTLQVRVSYDRKMYDKFLEKLPLLAHDLQQECVVAINDRALWWVLYYSDKRVKVGESTDKYPVKV